MSILKKPFKFYFFKTKKEKVFIVRALKSGNFYPFLLYCIYLMRLSSFLLVKRNFYTIHLHYSPYAFWLYFHRERTRKEEEFVNSYLSLGDTFIDCGAHLGTVSLTASQKVGADGKVISIEAHPKTFVFLNKNIVIAPYKNIESIHAAILEKEEKVFMTTHYVGDMNHVSERNEGVEVNGITLESILVKIEKVNLLKIDVEGKEFEAMKGAGKSLRKVEAILFESASASFKRYGFELRDIIKLLWSLGFTVYRFPKESEKILTRVEVTYETKTRYEDLIALSPSGKTRFQKKGGTILFS